MDALKFVEHGSGIPLVVLHGVGVDHRETEAALEPLIPHDTYRRIYLDLPGMGESSAEGMDSNQDAVGSICSFIGSLGQPVLLLGHSYGAYLARGVAAGTADAVGGLALLCPIGDGAANAPGQTVVYEDPGAHDELETSQRKDFDDYFVVRTRETARRYRDAVAPGKELVDEAALERVFANWKVSVDGYGGPTLIVAGRRDSTAGYEHSVALLGNTRTHRSP